MRIAWQSEIDPYASAVLKKHWPDVPNLGDIRSIQWDAVEPVDVLCGGWPCQTWSTAARGKNNHPDMWPEVLRAVRALRPRWLLAENVPRALHARDRMASELRDEGYELGTCVADVALPERQRERMRAVVVAYADRNGKPLRKVDAEAPGICAVASGAFDAYPGTMGVADGIPSRVDRLRCLRNAVPPQIAEAIGRAIMREPT